MKVESVLKLRSGGTILHLKNLEAANWIRSIEVEMSFTKSFAEFAYFKDRHSNILVPRIPITFDPNNPAHLREIEEFNSLSTSSILKASMCVTKLLVWGHLALAPTSKEST